MAPYVLVVESDAELQRRIGDTLRQANYELAAETDAAWAKRSLLVRPPDAVILATTLSDGSGFGVAEALRRDPDTKSVPIFFVDTRPRGAAHEAEARRRFAPAEYLPAPVDLNSLLATVLQRVPPGDPQPAPALPPDPSVVDGAQTHERSAVEEAARELGGSAELRGSLSAEPFARILHRIYAQRATGALLLMRDEVKKIVYFNDGYPVSVRSNVLAECLGQILLHTRLISPATLMESLRRMKLEGKQQGAILVEMGALSPFNLQRALLAQMEAKLYDVFSWRTGDFAFSKGKAAPDEPVRLDRAPAALILEGIRRHYDEERIAAVLAPYTGRVVAPSSDRRKRLQDITADDNERRFVESVDGARMLETLLAQAPVPLARARLLLVAMSEAAMIAPGAETARDDAAPLASSDLMEEISEPDTLSGPPPGDDFDAEEAADLRASPFDDTGERPAAPKSQEELQALAETMRDQTHFEVLRLEPTASRPEVERAYAALARQYHPDRFRFRPEELRALALQVFERLGQAHEELSDDQRRRAYRAALGVAQPDLSGPIYTKGAPPASAERVYFAGVEHLRAQRYRDAVRAFRQATQLAPLEASYRAALGWAMYRQAPADAAAVEAGRAELLRAVQMDQGNGLIRVSLGRFYAETGRADDAIAEFEVALRLSPGLSDIEDEIRRLRGLP